jgi:hypothetical protein
MAEIVSNTTIVTGLWDLGRGKIEGWAQRDFQQYKDRFFELLEADIQMCIWIPRELEQEVRNIRGDKPTQIYFRELKIENNFYIKDLFYDQTTTNYWIYNIDGFEYYVPNYGYLVLFDSKYSDINSIVNNSNPNQREFKICSNKLFSNKNGSFPISNNDVFYYLQLKEILSSYNFQTKLPSLGTHAIDPVICTLINNIESKTYNNIIKNIFIDQFKEYLNNRVGTSLMVSEKEIVNAYYKPNLNPGKLLVFRERFDLYKWVIYKEDKKNNKHIIITKDNNNKYSEIEIHQNKLIGFPPNEKINLNNITDQNIIEKFFLGNIV